MAHITGSIKQLKCIPSLVLNLQSNKFDVGNLTQNNKEKHFLFISCEETTSFVPPLLGLCSFSPPKKNKIIKD